MNLTYNTANKTDKGLIRKNNEDSMGTANTPNGVIFTVCDGMGGHVAGQIASSIAVESILDFFNKQKYSDIKNALHEALQLANNQIITRSKEQSEFKGMGTTATVLLIKNDEIHIAHIGDSRIYLKADNNLYRLTKDHSLVQRLVDDGILTKEEAETDKRKNKITKALGIIPIIKPTISEQAIYPLKNDIFLLCSDGLHDMIKEDEILNILSDNNSSIDKKSENLLNTALKNGGKDNVTLQLIEVTNSPYSERKFEYF